MKEFVSDLVAGGAFLLLLYAGFLVLWRGLGPVLDSIDADPQAGIVAAGVLLSIIYLSKWSGKFT